MSFDQFPGNYFHNAHDYDVDPHAGNVQTLAVVQHGGLDQQSNVHVRHVRYSRRFDVVGRRSSSAVSGDVDVKTFNVKEEINYVSIQPSARDNAVIVSLGEISFINIGGVYYPIGDFLVRTGAGLQVYRVPTAQSYNLSVYIVPPSGFAAEYTDSTLVAFGYLPDGLEKVAIYDGR